MEDQPLMDNMSQKSKKSNKSNKSQVPPSTCCCCNCACEDEYTKDETCCGCFPVKCGIHCVGILTYVITIIAVVFAFFQFLNEFFPWWYPAVTLILFIPLIIALVFFISFWIKENDGSRGRLVTACILVIISFALVFLWHVIFSGKTPLARTSILRDDQNQICKVGARCPNHQKLIMHF